MLKWSESDFAEFFGVEVDKRDAPHTFEYEVSRNGLRLRLTILALEHTVFVRVFRDGLPEPVFIVRRDLCAHPSPSRRGRAEKKGADYPG
jgi:hypothetical protein